MAAPTKPEPEEQTPGRTVVEFDDIERALGEGGDPNKPAPTPQDLFNQRLEGDSIPERLRGKTLGDALRSFEGMGEALRISEKAREDLARFADRPASVAAPAPVAPPAPKELTEDEVNELFKENPAKAIALLWSNANSQIVHHIDQRLAPLTNSSASAAEEAARTKYALEFELFGPEIKQMYDSIPDKSIFGQSAAWKDMITFIRGKDDNLDKYVAAKANGGKPTTVTTARAAEAASAGFHPTTVQRAPAAAVATGNEDPIKREIAEKLGFATYEEYVKWEKLGR